MSLENWLEIGWLRQDEPTLAEIQGLFGVVDRKISDMQAQGLSADGRFEFAYDAALQLCMIALRARGYRPPKGQSQHKRAIESLQFTLGSAWSHAVDHIERCRRLRNKGDYERSGLVSQQDADDLLETARRLRVDVVEWLKANHATLVLPGL